MNVEVNGASRRRFLAMGALASTLLVGCSARAPQANIPAPNPDGFPMTINHRFGATELTKLPARVAAIGVAEAESLTALGMVPVARPDSENTSYFGSAMRAQSDYEAPLFFDDGRLLNADTFKKATPDVIISVGKRLSKAEYDSLSQLAPVMLAPENLNTGDWAAVLDFVARVTGLSAYARELESQARDEIREIAGNYPDLVGATALFATVSSTPGSDIVLYGPASAPMNFVTTLGMKASPLASSLTKGLQAASARYPEDTWYLPRARARELSADALILGISGDDYNRYKSAKELSSDFPTFGTGGVLVIAGDQSISMTRPSILGTQWAARNIVPEIAKTVYVQKHGR